ncbi:hypothetical protein, partial [Pseudomonas kitaguniensis]|uniref:hypothetical protein n=1 Tax=Pseudomonas kitaguniensis TaxID=2607908 RepID=UPI0019D50BE0
MGVLQVGYIFSIWVMANPASCRVIHGFKPACGHRGLSQIKSNSTAAEAELSGLERIKCGFAYTADLLLRFCG